MKNNRSCFDCKHKEVKPTETPCNECLNLHNSEYSQWEAGLKLDTQQQYLQDESLLKEVDE